MNILISVTISMVINLLIIGILERHLRSDNKRAQMLVNKLVRKLGYKWKVTKDWVK